MTVVVYSFDADSSLLDCSDLVGFFFCFFLVGFSSLCLQVGNRLGFWGGFSCFVSFMWWQLFAWLIREAIFRLPPAFVFCSFFLCHWHLWSILSFLATVSFFHGLLCRRSLFVLAGLFVFALLALVSGYHCISQFWVSCCALCACCSSAASSGLEIRTGFFCKSVTLWTAALQIPL